MKKLLLILFIAPMFAKGQTVSTIMNGDTVKALNPFSSSTVNLNHHIEVQQTLNVSANTTLSIPAGYSILQVVVENTTGNSVTGGIKIGTTNGGTDVITALAVNANALFAISDASLLKKIFSMSSAQTLYIQTVTILNSANLNFYFVLRKVN